MCQILQDFKLHLPCQDDCKTREGTELYISQYPIMAYPWK